MRTRIRKWAIGGLLLSGAWGLRGEDQASASAASDFTGWDLTKLLDTPITTITRKPEKASETASATYVITQEDIHRSGATTIAEALRMAPGLDVARIDASRWAISSRGFNDFFADKLLVLRDGRSVYTPLFSGVFWDVQDAVLEDVERIEVTRGPGASLWGANAVNGIINIITKSAKDTQGTLLTAGGGTEERGFGAARYGGKINDDAFFRVYAKFSDRDDSPNRPDNPPPFGARPGMDGWNLWQTGFRTDWTPSQSSHFRLQGDVYHGDIGQEVFVIAAPTPTTPPVTKALWGDGTVTGGNVLGSWSQNFSATSELTVQSYYDRTDREDRVHNESRDTFDLDAQHRFMVGERNEIMYGAGYRYTHDQLADGIDNSGAIRFVPDHKGDQLVSSFVQDEITIFENGPKEHLKLTVGSKFEHNDYTGFEIQPSGRVAWTEGRHTLWGAVSRAVRTPARFEHTLDAWFGTPTATSPVYTKLEGNPAYKSEEVLAYEVGYRVQPLSNVSFDLTGFYNDYNHLRAIAPEDLKLAPFGPVLLLQPQNSMDGETYGFELAANWKVMENWRLSGGYSLLKMELHAPAGVVLGEVAEKESPQNQFNLRSYIDLPYNLQLDTVLYYVDNLAGRNVPSYTRLDMRLGWRPTQKKDLEFSVVVQNILDPKHPEFGTSFLVNPHEIERSVYAKVTWRF